jgi:hypothetical protein
VDSLALLVLGSKDHAQDTRKNPTHGDETDDCTVTKLRVNLRLLIDRDEGLQSSVVDLVLGR